LQSRDGIQQSSPGTDLPFQTLERLDLSGVHGLRDYVFPNLGVLPQLLELRLQDVPLPVEDTRWQIFAGAKKLRLLELSDLTLDESRVRRLAEIATLEQLELPRCGIDDAGARTLAKGRCPLRRLGLAGNMALTDSGAAELAAIGTLAEVDLTGCSKVTEQGLRRLTERQPPIRVAH